MYGKYFIYDGKSSQDYGLMLGSLDNSDSIPFAMSREVYQGTLNRFKNKVNHMGTKWAEVLQFTISCIKDVCQYPNDMVFTEDEVNEINSWLTSPDYPLLFHMYDEKNKIPLDEFSDYVLQVYNSWNTETEGPVPEDLVAAAEKASRIKEQEQGNSADTSESTDSTDATTDPDSDELEEFEEETTESLDPVKKIEWTQSDADEIYNNYTEKFDELFADRLYTNLKYDYFGVFSNVEPQLLDGDVIGFTMTFTTNSPFAWTPEKTVTAESTEDAETELTLTVDDSQRYRELYPMIEIIGDGDNEFTWDSATQTYTGTASAREEITITNTNDISYEYKYSSGGYTVKKIPRSLTLKVPHTNVYIDSEKAKIYDRIVIESEYISHVLTFEDLGLEDISHIYWPRLFNGENKWTVKGNCKIKVTWREPRKVGAY